jgi:hypothetical protein
MLAQRGSGLFELAVTVVVLGVLITVLLTRIADYQEQAEDVVVQQLIANMRTSLAVRVAQLKVAEEGAAIRALVGSNPLNLLNKFPANYGGEVVRADLNNLRERNWYFLSDERTLVYLLNHHKTVAIKGQKSLNFKVKLLHSSNKAVQQETTDSSPSLILESV